MNTSDENMRVIKATMGKDDPGVAILETIAAKLGSLEDAILDLSDEVNLIKETGGTLRVARARNFWVILSMGVVFGSAGTWYWMSTHGFMGSFWAHGVKVHTIENSNRLELKISGDNIETLNYVKDATGKIIGFQVVYLKQSHP